jgi:ketosteroid isomerase-like protein
MLAPARLAWCLALILALCLAVACKERSAPPVTRVGDAGPARAAASGDAAAPGDRAPAEAEVRALLDRWMVAQNRGDFDAYAVLYAAGFTGVRRSGASKVDLDRAAWLRDRKRMFDRPVAVTVDQVSVAADGDAARIDFVQTWTSGSYSDRGPKRMRVVREEGGLRIAREEMLESQLVGAPASADAGAYDDAGSEPGSFTGKGRSEVAILRVHEGETSAPHGEESGEQGFLQTERRAELIVERSGRQVASGDLGSWTDGWEWGTKLALAGTFRLGQTGVDAIVVRQVASTEGGQSVTISVLRAVDEGVDTLWEASADDASVSIGTDSIDVSLVEAGEGEPFFGDTAGRDRILTRDVELRWKGGALVEKRSP